MWRGMSSGNKLLAHAVGAGKMFTMAATGMKMKQAGLIKEAEVRRPEPFTGTVRTRIHELDPNAAVAGCRQGGPFPRTAARG